MKIALTILVFLTLGTVYAQSQKANSALLDELSSTQYIAVDTQRKYINTAVQYAEQSAIKFTHGGECQSSCPYGCCESGESLMYEGAVFMMFNNLSTARAEQSYQRAQQACQTYNKVAVSPKDCNAEVKPFEKTKPESSWFDDKGFCKATAPSECAFIRASIGGSVFASKSTNCKKRNPPCQVDFYNAYKFDQDGNLIVKFNNKSVKLTKDSFKDKNSLVSAGVASKLAEQLLSQYQKLDKAMGLEEEFYSKTSSENLLERNGAEAQQSGEPRSENFVYKVEKIFKDDVLTVRYNGESIHVSTENIFKIIKQRYKENERTLLP